MLNVRPVIYLKYIFKIAYLLGIGNSRKVVSSKDPTFQTIELVQLVKCLPRQQEDLSAIPRTRVEGTGTAALLCTPVMGRQSRVNTWGSLAS